MSTPRLRPAARALIVDEYDRLLLCRFDLPRTVVWAAPGGGVETGESTLDGLRRELREEVGLDIDSVPPRVWHQEVVADGHAAGYDGVINDYFLVRAAHFTPRGSFTDDELAAEGLAAFRWWSHTEILTYDGDTVFSPRDLGALIGPILAGELPEHPLALGV